MEITERLMAECFPQARQQDINNFDEALDVTCYEFEINTSMRMAAFLAQVAHESGNFRSVRENLNYSADGLRKIFPKYFTDVDPNLYARQPEKIANRVYANRMGNGPESSGDGWAYRGRGLIQLTGKFNYIQCGNALGVDLVNDPSYLETPIGAARSAGWYWSSRGLNAFADKGDMTSITRRINGGTIGLEDRIKHYRHALHVLESRWT
jgi:putative chitinase